MKQDIKQIAKELALKNASLEEILEKLRERLADEIEYFKLGFDNRKTLIDLKSKIEKVKKQIEIENIKNELTEFAFTKKQKALALEEVRQELDKKINSDIIKLSKKYSYTCIFENLEHFEAYQDYIKYLKTIFDSDDIDLITLDIKELYYKQVKKIKGYYKTILDQEKVDRKQVARSPLVNGLVSIGTLSLISKWARSKTRF